MSFFKLSSLPLRKSVLLISGAILVSTTVQAKIDIGRLPSVHAGDGQVVGAKPNVFLIIDNSKSMTGSKNQMEYDPNGNYLQQTAGALIAALPQLEGKVRLGYSTIFKGTYALSGINYGGKQLSCQEFKLNGNVNRLDPFIPGLKADLANNPNYVTGDEDFVFNDSGSGYGNTVPRDFRDNYARYIYAWLGAMCMGSTSDKDSIPYGNPWNAPLVPPYADLKDKDAYRAAAVAAKNKNSYPVVNFIGINTPKKTHKPLIDMYVRVLGQVSDEKFICSLEKNSTGGAKCIYTDLSAERSARGNATLRNYPEHSQWKYLTYDAYAPTRDDNGFPDDKNPLSCRKNYTIMISHGAYGEPSDKLRYNSKVGTEGWGIDGQGKTDGWRMPNGREFPRSGYLGDITRMYRFLPVEGNSEVREIPKSSYIENGKIYNVQGAYGRFLLSKMILQSYYQDLRSNLPDDVQPYIAGSSRRHGPNNKGIPPFWDRKNDPAPWQHMTFFALGFTDDKESSFPSWQYANRAYKPYYKDLDPEGGILEPYFRAIEDGTIYAANQPLYDWGRGGYGLGKLPMSYYFYKNPQNNTVEQFKIGPDHFQGSKNLEAWGETLDMDYAKAGIIGRGGAYEITDYTSIKKVIESIASRIETAMAQGISGGAISGGGRITASQQAAGGNESILFTTYLDQENASGNIFAFKNCPLIKQMIYEDGNLRENPDWVKNNCGKRLWNAASVLYDGRKDIGAKTIIPIQSGGKLEGKIFSWQNIQTDNELKKRLSGGNDKLGEERVKWINGALQSELDSSFANDLRARGQVFIPDETQHFKRNPDGSLEKDDQGNVVLADPTNIPNLMGDVVYALPKAVDNRGTLPAAHPLNNEKYAEFIIDKVSKRKPLVLTGANDGRFYGFSVAKEGEKAADSENAQLAFSFIPRTVVTKEKSNLTTFTTPNGLEDIKSGADGGRSDGLVNGPFTVRDAQVDNKWGTYVVGTLGQGGDAIFALDITEVGTRMFKWEVSDRGYGHIMAEPRIVWLRSKTNVNGEPTGKWVVIVPTGYNADSVSLVILDLANGDEIAKINTMAKYKENGSTPEGNKICSFDDHSQTEESNPSVWKKLKSLGDVYLPSNLTCDNGLGQLTVFDADSDSGADFVFAGDLFGHVWKFDLRDALDSVGQFQKERLKIAYNSPLFIAQTPLETLSNSNPDENEVATAAKKSTRQPITAMITIDDGAYGEGSMLYFGTGRMFNQRERGLEQQQSFYGVWDIPRYSCDECEGTNNTYPFSLPLRRNPALVKLEKSDDLLAKSAKYDFIRYETFNISKDKVADKNNSSLKHYDEIRGLKRTDRLDSSEFLSFDLKGGQSNPDDKAVGWIIDFPAKSAIERVINRAYSFEDNIFFSSFSPKGGSSGESCGPVRSGVGGDARFYMVDRLTGKQLEKSPFDFNNDGTQDDEKGKDGVKFTPGDLGKGGDLKKLSYDKEVDTREECEKNSDPDYNCEEGTISLSPASIMIGKGAGDFLSVIGVLERSKQATDKHNCDYNRQIIFPSTADPITGNPRVLSSCNRNRYRVWKQPAIE